MLWCRSLRLALTQIPLVERTLPLGRRVSVLTYMGSQLGPDHLAATDASPDTPLLGTEDGPNFWRVTQHSETELDVAAAREDILETSRRLVPERPDAGAIVLECTSMVPFARALHSEIRLSVYKIRRFIAWLRFGFDPAGFA